MVMIRINSDNVMHDVQVGDFLSEFLVTDTRVVEVIKTTAKTVTFRSTKWGDMLEKSSGSFPIVYKEALSNKNGEIRTLRVRKDGTLRTHINGASLKPTREINGKPVSKTDYSF